MFYQYTTVKIEKDKNYIQYIKIIREYDNSLSMAQLKKAIDNGEVVFSYDPKDNQIIANGKDNTMDFLETYFVRTLKALKKAGAEMVVEDSNGVYHEFYKKQAKKKKPESKKADIAFVEEIEKRWALPEVYLDYLRKHAKSQYIKIEDEKYGYDIIEIEMYGAEDLIKGQEGYSYNPLTNEKIEEWDENLVVIAYYEGDPFCIDISADRSPVYYAMHGMDEWDFDIYTDSIEEFLKMLDL